MARDPDDRKPSVLLIVVNAKTATSSRMIPLIVVVPILSVGKSPDVSMIALPVG